MRTNNIMVDVMIDACGESYIPTPMIIQKKNNIIVFGDIHGDIELAKKLLTTSKVAKYKRDKLIWIGKDTHIVQVGDQIDRCRPYGTNGRFASCNNINTTYEDEGNDTKILKLFNNLHKQAIKDDGGVYSLLGNHEIMNSKGWMNYVSYEGFREFDDYVDPTTGVKFTDGIAGRKHAFAPGNEYGKLLGCSRTPAIIIGSNLFVHAGLIDSFIEKHNIRGADDLNKLNTAIKSWLVGILDNDADNYIDKIVTTSDDSFFWTRALGMLKPNVNNSQCDKYITNVMKIFKIDHMVIGHTPQFSYDLGINSTCDAKIWRVDTGASRAFNNFGSGWSKYRTPQYLHIKNDSDFYVCDMYGCKQQIH